MILVTVNIQSSSKDNGNKIARLSKSTFVRIYGLDKDSGTGQIGNRDYKITMTFSR
jgi:hypothetical protein